MNRDLPHTEADSVQGNGQQPESITEEERLAILALKQEIDSMKHRQVLLSREHILLSADVIRKEEELERKGLALAKKYGLHQKGPSVDMKTGKLLYPKEG